MTHTTTPEPKHSPDYYFCWECSILSKWKPVLYVLEPGQPIPQDGFSARTGLSRRGTTKIESKQSPPTLEELSTTHPLIILPDFIAEPSDETSPE